MSRTPGDRAIRYGMGAAYYGFRAAGYYPQLKAAYDTYKAFTKKKSVGIRMPYAIRRPRIHRYNRRPRPTRRFTRYRAKPKVKVYRRRFTRSRTFRRRR